MHKIYNATPHTLKVAIATLSLSLGAIPSLASAQTAASSLEEIIVTVQRRKENLQSVPMSITALDATTLENNSATSLNDLIYLVPSLSFSETGYGQDAIIANIRGQGVFGGRNPAVGLYLNEAPLPQVGPSAPGAFLGGQGLFYDLENIQVVKGPQGTLFGRNTTGGAFLMQTRRPGDAFGGDLQVGYGNFDNTEVNGAIDVPLVDDVLLMRVAVMHQSRDGFIDIESSPGHSSGVDAHNVDSTGGRLTLTWKPTEAIQNDLIVSDFRSRTNGTQLLINRLTDGSFVPFIFPDIVDVIAKQRALGLDDAVPQSLTPRYDVDLFTVNNLTEIELSDNLLLRNIFSYTEQNIYSARSFDGTALSIFQRYSVGDSPEREQTTEEIQLQGRSLNERLEWTIGYFYLDLPFNGFETLETFAFGGAFGPPTRLGTDYSEKSSAFYGQASYNFTDNLKFTAGYRRTTDEAEGIQVRLNSANQCVNTAPPYDANCTLTLDDEWNANTWNIALDYQWTEGTLVYAAVRRGFRSGGFNFISVSNESNRAYGPEQVTDFEIGLKSDWELVGMPIRSNIALYYDEFEGAQVTRALPEEGLVLAIDNAAEAEIRGLELEVMMQPSANLEIAAHLSLLDFEFTKFLPGTLPQDIAKIKGSELYGRPESTYGISFSYDISAGAAGMVNLYANYSYTSEMFTNTDNRLSRFDPHGLLNLTANWKDIFGRPYDLSFFMTNALDEDYRAYTIAEPTLGYAAYGYGTPRMYGLRFKYRFGAEGS